MNAFLSHAQAERVGSQDVRTTKSRGGSTVVLNWLPVAKRQTLDEKTIEYLTFKGALEDPDGSVPIYRTVKKLATNIDQIDVSLEIIRTEPIPDDQVKLVNINDLSRDFSVRSVIRSAAGSKHHILEIVPLRKGNGGVERLVEFRVVSSKIESKGSRDGARDLSWKSTSVLNAGNWYKLKTGEDGVYKVTYGMMRDMGMNMSNVASGSIVLYGTGAGQLSMKNSDPRPDDLYPIPIRMEDDGDGQFDPGDYFLFYGEDQILWEPKDDTYVHRANSFADSTAYFLSIDAGVGNADRITTSPALSHDNVVNTYDYLEVHEDYATNLIKSGREWYGEQLGLIPEVDIGFNIPNVLRNREAKVRCRFAVRSVSISDAGLTLSMPNQGSFSGTKLVDAVGSRYGSTYAVPEVIELEFLPTSSDFLTKAKIENSTNPNAQGWLDYITVHARRELSFIQPQMEFRDRESVAANRINQYVITRGARDLHVWDVTNPRSIVEMDLSISGTTYRFTARADSLKTFFAFSEQNIKIPAMHGMVENQNLHSLSGIDYLVITHPKFRTYAEQLAQYHEDEDGFNTAVVDVYKIYNEFSGGVQDITAIREFVRMIYVRSVGSDHELKYLLLFGDGSYDYKDRISGNSNFVPSHQTAQSLVPTSSVVSDDYYGLLDEDEAESTADLIDIGIGRLPARTKNEAQQMVSKILNYSNNSSATLGDWRNWVALVADDPENKRATFQTQSSTIAELADSLSPEFNFQKIYMDGYKQVTGSGGERYPDVSEAISERVRKGALLMYYIGHGGELGWAHERVLEVPVINKWSNKDNLPLFITATCEFTRYDDPRRTSAGEYVMLNPSGGGVALLTTTRAVYAGPNFDLTYSFTRQAFESLSNNKPRLGDMTAQTKVENASTSTAGFNTRCFTLLGDPAMKLAFPREQVIITSLPDTMSALDKVEVSGIVADQNGNRIEGFNGLVYPTVFDKVSTIQGQNNDGEGVYFYEERRNIIFRGKASVKNGRFTFEFVVPKDIDRSFGDGKISLYAENGSYDASGSQSEFMIGGLSKNPVTDTEGPDVDLFMNNAKFVFGGMTNQDPDLYAEVQDENGVNMVGTGIGHDITAVLDDNGANTIVLNDYYEADVDSYQSGKIRYPFNELEQGRHTLKLQVWDVNNNPTDAYTEFVVANDAKFALDHILNYPNPFTTNTDFYFEHNKPGLSLDVRIEIFTVSGKLVKTLEGDFLNNGFRVGPINWNGRDKYGDRIGKGVYLYRIRVKTPSGEVAEEFEKLVLLN
ncbi:MAG: type IX secretion system sortase PorU [Salibacteraceae bacterium]